MPAEALSEVSILREQPRLGPDDRFTFECRKDLDCFTHCCRDVSIVLTPYDVLRLKRSLGLDSSEFLARHTISPFTGDQKFPALLLKMLNQALLERQVEARFVSLLVLLWQPETRRLVMANAGALPPVICRGGNILQPRVEGVPVGLLPDREYDEVVFEAQAGDLVVLYSDGITDQLNPAGEDYGRSRLLSLLQRVRDCAPREAIEAIFADVDRFTGFAPAFDDQTLVVLKVT